MKIIGVWPVSMCVHVVMFVGTEVDLGLGSTRDCVGWEQHHCLVLSSKTICT
jgi:hypothetical protein